MQRTIIIVIAAVVALALLSRAMTYTVRFTEAGVLTTFGSASESNVRSDPGLYFKWPEPIQSVTKYDTRKRLLRTRLEGHQTADDRLLVVEVYCLWKVENPLQFFKRWSNAGPRAVDHYRKAEDVLRSALRDAMSEVSKYRMDELFVPTGKQTKVAELEARVLASLRTKIQSDTGNGALTGNGLETIDVGISKIVFPEATTEQVMEQMRTSRATIIKEIESRGKSQAQTIIDTAEQNSQRIINFARSRAQEIRSLGDQEAQQYVAQMNEHPEFAVFLKRIELMRTWNAKQTTLVISTDGLVGETMTPKFLESMNKNGNLPAASPEPTTPRVGGGGGSGDRGAGRPSDQEAPR